MLPSLSAVVVVADMPIAIGSRARWPMDRGVGSGIKGLEELRIPLGPLVPPLVPDEDPVVRWPTPVPEVVRMVPTNPPLAEAFPARALPQVAAANIRKSIA